MPTLAPTYTELHFASICRVLSSLTGESSAALEQLAQTLLAEPEAHTTRCSDINVNGSPLQFLMAFRDGRSEVRLIGDAAFDQHDPLRRWQRSLSALDQLIALRRAEAMREIIDAFLFHVVPSAPAALRTYPTGMLRLASTLGTNGLAVYASPPPATPEVNWLQARILAQQLLPAGSTATQLIDRLAPCCNLFGAGLEGRKPASARLKLYWRMAQPGAIAGFGLPLFDAPMVHAFLSSAVPSGNLPLHALTFSAGFDLPSGTLLDTKVDVCLHNAEIGLDRASECVLSTARRLALDVPSLKPSFELFRASGIAVACLGLGFSAHAGHRINLYGFQTAPRPDETKGILP